MFNKVGRNQAKNHNCHRSFNLAAWISCEQPERSQTRSAGSDRSREPSREFTSSNSPSVSQQLLATSMQRLTLERPERSNHVQHVSPRRPS